MDETDYKGSITCHSKPQPPKKVFFLWWLEKFWFLSAPHSCFKIHSESPFSCLWGFLLCSPWFWNTMLLFSLRVQWGLVRVCKCLRKQPSWEHFTWSELHGQDICAVSSAGNMRNGLRSSTCSFSTIPDKRTHLLTLIKVSCYGLILGVSIKHTVLCHYLWLALTLHHSVIHTYRKRPTVSIIS